VKGFLILVGLLFAALAAGCQAAGTGGGESEGEDTSWLITEHFQTLIDFAGGYRELSREEKIAYILRAGDLENAEQTYVMYLPRDLAFAYHLTGDENIKRVVADIVTICETEWTRRSGQFRSPLSMTLSFWSRDHFGREMRLLYGAYEYTGLKGILPFIEEQAVLWTATAPRNYHNGFLIYPFGVNNETGAPQSYEICPNQNLTLAVLFSYLYWEENSRFYRNEGLRDIVYNEVNATLALQKENGSLPIREGLPLVEDTNYGGLCGEYLFTLAQLWGEEAWIAALKRLGAWLYTEYPMSHPWNTKEDYPNFSAERFDMYNLIGRIVPFYAAGVDGAYTRQWIDFAKAAFPASDPIVLSRGYIDRSIPPEYFGIDTRNRLPPRVNMRYDGDDIRIVVVSPGIDSVRLVVKDGDQVTASMNIGGGGWW